MTTSVLDRHRAGAAAPLPPRCESRTRLFNRICIGVLIAFALLWLIPLAWAIDTSLKPNTETVKTTWLIDNPTIAAYPNTLKNTDMLKWYGASFITSALTALLTVITASMAAYALSRMRFRYKNVVFWFDPGRHHDPGPGADRAAVPRVLAVRLLNTFWAVICRRSPTAIAVFIFKQFFDGLPRTSTRRPGSTAPAPSGSTGRSSCR